MRKKGILYVVFAAMLAAAFGACGNPLEGGSEPSGSVLRTGSLEVKRGIAGSTVVAEVIQQDLYFCEGREQSYLIVLVNVLNDSIPNSDEPTNSYVTVNRYRVDYAVLNMSATLPGLDGGGFSVGLPPMDQITDNPAADEVIVNLVTEPMLEYIRSNYPEVGNGQAMNVRADITIWGTDAFQVDVSTQASVTFTIDDFDPCTTDLLPADEAGE